MTTDIDVIIRGDHATVEFIHKHNKDNHTVRQYKDVTNASFNRLVRYIHNDVDAYVTPRYNMGGWWAIIHR